MTIKNIRNLYQELKTSYGRPQGQWRLWCRRPKTWLERQEVIIGAILTQRANWRNVELAINNLKQERVSSLAALDRLAKRQPGRLGRLIRPSGFYRQKAVYLAGLASFMIGQGGLKGLAKVPTGELRQELLGLKGLGPETADSILLYGLDRPVFVVDEYTRRLVKERGLTDNLSYNSLQQIFERGLKKDYRFYQDYHALIVIDGKNKNSRR